MSRIMKFAGDPGAGKTMEVLKKIITEPGRYVYAGSRVELVADAHTSLLEAEYTGHMEMIVMDRSKVKVQTRIENFVRDHDYDARATLLITHASLMTADMNQFEGWNLIIDEVPANAVMTDSLHGKISLPILQSLFNLQPHKPGVMLLTSKPAALSDILGDKFFASIANLWLRARSCPVYIECSSWADIARKPCPWVSTWSLRAVSSFQSVIVAAAGLEKSLVHLCDPQPYDTTSFVRPPSKAKVRIECFDDLATFSSAFFETQEGINNIALIGDYLKNPHAKEGDYSADPGRGVDFWTCNSSFQKRTLSHMPGGYVSPMQEGSNRLREFTRCGAFYSAKPTPSDKLMRKLYGISKEQIEAAREWEHLSQFVMRGKIRDHSWDETKWDGVYRIYVYSQGQAERLAGYLRGIGFADTEVTLVRLNGMRAKPPAKKRGPKAYLTAEEKTAKKKEQNAKRPSKKRPKSEPKVAYKAEDFKKIWNPSPSNGINTPSNV